MTEKKKLGFGLMRLPQKNKEIDLEKTCELVDKFIESGFCYFDTAYCYPGSEVALKKTVSQRYPRDKYEVATKMAGWLLNEKLTPEKMFETQLERCGVDYFDYYLLHSLQPSKLKCYDEFNCWEFCLKQKAEGKIKHFGFSFHGKPELLEEILQKHPEVDFVQLQINYMDWEDENVICAKENHAVVCKYNKDIIVMEPVRGGLLANLPKKAAEKFGTVKTKDSQASYALRFAATLANVTMVLSGMNTFEQLDDNINTFTNLKQFTDEEKAVINDVKNTMLSVNLIPCTACGYCVDGCVKKINIPEIFSTINLKNIYGSSAEYKNKYKYILSLGSGKASDCVKCGKCEKACPQHIKIVSQLKEVSQILDE